LTRGWNRVGLKKKRGKEKPGVDPADLIANPLTFIFFVFFLLKRCRFDFFLKKKNQPGNLVKTRNPGLGPGQPPDPVLKL
jgi:hypothetical protein